MDGNQKIRRSVCMAVDAGFIQYPSLPGVIKTGCTRTPGFNYISQGSVMNTYLEYRCIDHSIRI